ncbi:MAG: aspartyl protease family protein [Hymenobacter sp.]|nr:aspartyl protease family protein [Hymenobacter sp.]
MGCIGPVLAQQPMGAKPLDQLLLAIANKSVEPLRAHLSEKTQIGKLPAAYTTQVLAQLIPQFGPVTNARLVRQQQEGANTRYVYALTRKDVEKEYDFLVSPEGIFLELNLAQASVKKIDTSFGPQDLTLPPSLDIPVKLVKGLILVEADVDGRRGTFVLDSGAPALMLNKREFATPNTQSVATADAPRGINGSVGGMSFYAIKRFDWMGISFHDKEVATLDLAAIEQKLGGVPLLGLIGYNLLSQYALTLDYHAGRIELRRPGSATAAGSVPVPLLTVPFKLRGHLPVVALTVDGKAYEMALDCGAQTNLLDQQYAPAFEKKLRKRSQDTLQGAGSDSRTVISGQIPEMRLAGALPLRHQQTVFTDISHLNQKPDQAVIQGIAGYPMLSQYRTTIDYVNKQLLVSNW